MLNTNVVRTEHGVLTKRQGALTNDRFVNLLDRGTGWKATTGGGACLQGATVRVANSNGPEPEATSSSSQSFSLWDWLKSMGARTRKRRLLGTSSRLGTK